MSEEKLKNGTRYISMTIFQVMFAITCIFAGYSVSTSVLAMNLTNRITKTETHDEELSKRVEQYVNTSNARFSDIVMGIKAQHDQGVALLQALDKSNALMMQQNQQYSDRIRKLEERTR